MSVSSEKGLEAAFHDVVHNPPHRITWKLQDAFSSGIPDRLVCIDGYVTWVEIKYIRVEDMRKRTLDFKTGLRPEQRRRMREWAAAGGRAYLLMGMEVGELFLLDAMSCPPVETHITHVECIRNCELHGSLDRDTLRRVRDEHLTARFRPSGT